MSLEARLRRLERSAEAVAACAPCPGCGHPQRRSPHFFATPDTLGTPCPSCRWPRDADGLPFPHAPVILIDPTPLADIRARERMLA